MSTLRYSLVIILVLIVTPLFRDRTIDQSCILSLANWRVLLQGTSPIFNFLYFLSAIAIPMRLIILTSSCYFAKTLSHLTCSMACFSKHIVWKSPFWSKNLLCDCWKFDTTLGFWYCTCLHNKGAVNRKLCPKHD